MPAPPIRVSSPAPAFTVSLPASVSMRSFRAVPLSESSPAVGRLAEGFSTSAAENTPSANWKNSTSVTVSVPSLTSAPYSMKVLLCVMVKPPSMAVTV